MESLYGLKFKSFTPVDIGLRYTVLEKGQADLSILFTTDPQLSAESDKFVILEDDKEVFPAGNIIFVTEKSVAEEAGPDYEETILKVQEGLDLKVMQELDARVELEKETPKQAATAYLESAGYIGLVRSGGGVSNLSPNILRRGMDTLAQQASQTPIAQEPAGKRQATDALPWCGPLRAPLDVVEADVGCPGCG